LTCVLPFSGPCSTCCSYFRSYLQPLLHFFFLLHLWSIRFLLICYATLVCSCFAFYTLLIKVFRRVGCSLPAFFCSILSKLLFVLCLCLCPHPTPVWLTKVVIGNPAMDKITDDFLFSNSNR
jgi:hypothetical protein